MKEKVLYLSYDGMLEPLGASQVLSYLKKLGVHYEFQLLSFEKNEDFKDIEIVKNLKDELSNYNITWLPMVYQMGAKGYLKNIWTMYRQARSAIKKQNISLIHARSYMPAIVSYLLKKRLKNIGYIFDTRGFWFDEKLNTGTWRKSGPPYRLAKRFEKKLYLNATHIVMLSKKSITLIQDNKLFKGGDKLSNLVFIPTCTDLDNFYPDYGQRQAKIKIGYIGTAIGWYNFDKTVKMLMNLKEIVDYDLEIYNGGQHDFIKDTLAKHNFEDDYILKKVGFSEIPNKMRQLDLSIFFIKPVFSKNASAATKLGELMASGVPVITNNQIGDHEALIDGYKTGIIIDSEDNSATIERSQLEELLQPETKTRCRKLAEDVFSLEKGVENYLKIYKTYFA